MLIEHHEAKKKRNMPRTLGNIISIRKCVYDIQLYLHEQSGNCVNGRCLRNFTLSLVLYNSARAEPCYVSYSAFNRDLSLQTLSLLVFQSTTNVICESPAQSSNMYYVHLWVAWVSRQWDMLVEVRPPDDLLVFATVNFTDLGIATAAISVVV